MQFVESLFLIVEYYLYSQFIKQYDDEDLMEIVLPRLARVMTVWEFVLMKVCCGHSKHVGA